MRAHTASTIATESRTMRQHLGACGVTMEIRATIKGRVDVPKDAYLTFERAELVGETFSGRKLDQMGMSASSFTGCEFTDMRIGNWVTGGARTTVTRYTECVFDRSRIRFNPGGLARFERCSFRDVDLRDWMCFETELVDCVFTGRMRRSFFNGTVREELVEALGRTSNEFRGNDFSGMDLIDVDFRTGIDLSLQRLPTGSAPPVSLSSSPTGQGRTATSPSPGHGDRCTLPWQGLRAARRPVHARGVLPRP
jgi:uncharacterized protein YjbI with pentapeptide repeats